MECKKTKFANEKFAIEWIEKLKKTSIRKTKPIRAYLCFDCGGWHLTSKVLGEETQYQKQQAEIKELKSIIEKQKLDYMELQGKFNVFKRRVNVAINVSNKQLAISSGYKKEEQQNAFLYGCNKMRELIKALIKE